MASRILVQSALTANANHVVAAALSRHQQWAAAMWRIPLLLASAAATLGGWAVSWLERGGAGGQGELLLNATAPRDARLAPLRLGRRAGGG